MAISAEKWVGGGGGNPLDANSFFFFQNIWKSSLSTSIWIDDAWILACVPFFCSLVWFPASSPPPMNSDLIKRINFEIETCSLVQLPVLTLYLHLFPHMLLVCAFSAVSYGWTYVLMHIGKALHKYMFWYTEQLGWYEAQSSCIGFMSPVGPEINLLHACIS